MPVVYSRAPSRQRRIQRTKEREDTPLMKRNLRVGLAVLLALLIALQMVITVSASPPAPGDKLPLNPNESAPPAQTNVKPIDQPNIKDYQRNQARMRLLKSGRTEAADQLALTADDKVLVILVEFAGTDTFTWNPGDTWDPLGIADPDEAVYDAAGNLVVGDCSNIITQTQTFTYTGPLHNQIPRPLSAEDRSGDSIWTEDFSPNGSTPFCSATASSSTTRARTAPWCMRTSPASR